MTDLDARSRGDGRRARHAHALGDAEAPPSDPRPADGRLGSGSSKAARSGPARRDRLTREPRRVRRHSGGRAGEGARHGRRRPLGAAGAWDGRRERPRPLRRHAAPHDRAARGARRGAPARERRRDRPLLHPRRRPLVRTDRPRSGRDRGGDRRGGRCDARAAGYPGVQLVDLRLPRRAALARARPARAAQRPGRALPHRRRPRSRRPRRACRRPRRRRPRRDRGRQHARRAGCRGSDPPRPDQPRAHARGRWIADPARPGSSRR